MRFCLRWLFVAVGFVAISVVALLNANYYWVGTLRSITILFLSLAIVGSIFGSGRARAFLAGAAIVGTIQFANVGFAHWRSTGHLITDAAISNLYPRIARQHELEPPVELPGLKPMTVKFPDLDYFEKAARCIVTIVVALLGGCVGTWFYSRRESSKGSGQ